MDYGMNGGQPRRSGPAEPLGRRARPRTETPDKPEIPRSLRGGQLVSSSGDGLALLARRQSLDGFSSGHVARGLMRGLKRRYSLGDG